MAPFWAWLQLLMHVGVASAVPRLFNQEVAVINISDWGGIYGDGVDFPYQEDTSSWGTPCVGRSADESGVYYTVSIPYSNYHVVAVRWGSTVWNDATYVAFNTIPTPYVNVLMAEDSDENTETSSTEVFLEAGNHSLWIGSSSFDSAQWTVPWCAITIHGAAPSTTTTFSSSSGTSPTSTTTETFTTTQSSTTDTETPTSTVTLTITSTNTSMSLTSTATNLTTFTTSSPDWQFAGEADRVSGRASIGVLAIGCVLLCCLSAVCFTLWGRRRYQKVRPESTPRTQAKYEADPEPSRINPIITGLEVEVTWDPETFERECLALRLSWPHLVDGSSREQQRGLRGTIEEVNFFNRIVKLSGAIGWVPIRALSGFETWSCDQERLYVQGSTGQYASVVNGTYTLSLDPHSGQPAWRKDDAGDKWLARFDNGLWYLTSTERKVAGQAGGWMESSRQEESDPSRAGPWRVWTGIMWELQRLVMVERFRTLAPPVRPLIEEGLRWTDEPWNLHASGCHGTGWPAYEYAPSLYYSNGLGRAETNSPRYAEESMRYPALSPIMPSYDHGPNLR